MLPKATTILLANAPKSLKNAKQNKWIYLSLLATKRKITQLRANNSILID